MQSTRGGCQAWLKAQGSDPCLRDATSRRGNLVGVREFKSRPPHHVLFLSILFLYRLDKDANLSIEQYSDKFQSYIYLHNDIWLFCILVEVDLHPEVGFAYRYCEEI